MSHGGEIFGLGGDAASEPSFETALRGYEKKQVERYVARAENEIAALAAEREQAYQQIQAMAGADRPASAGGQPGPPAARRRHRGLVPASRAQGRADPGASPRSRPRRSRRPRPTTSPPGWPRPSGSGPRPRRTPTTPSATSRSPWPPAAPRRRRPTPPAGPPRRRRWPPAARPPSRCGPRPRRRWPGPAPRRSS